MTSFRRPFVIFFFFSLFLSLHISLRISMSTAPERIISLHWFRKGLRLHDNPALLHALHGAGKCFPVFCLDPHFARPEHVGVNRYNFLLESLRDIDAQLREEYDSRLFVLRGDPEEVLPKAVREWNVQCVTYERDTEPYARERDRRVCAALPHGVTVTSFSSHTLCETEQLIAALHGGEIPRSFQSFQKLFNSIGKVREPLPRPEKREFPPCTNEEMIETRFSVPTLQEMGYTEHATTPFRGGEREAVRRLSQTVCEREKYVCEFSKPDTSPNALEPSTTVLSPYLKFGCLSAAHFYHTLQRITHGKKHTEPPVSLTGQLLWREFYYFQSYTTPNFHKMEGNPVCRQIPWARNPALLEAWKYGRTGFPYIDAIMTQLRLQGWIHHLARHSVACFLTRGDLWQHWEDGARVFDVWLCDADYALNNGNWQWLSCSNFFYQYFRCYSPVTFGKKTDKNGDYIRHWIPQLAKLPAQFIYEPWKAPRHIQEEAKCVIGVDYPLPIVDHDTVCKENMTRMKTAYAAHNNATPHNATHSDGNERDTKKTSERNEREKRCVAKTSVLQQLHNAAEKRVKR